MEDALTSIPRGERVYASGMLSLEDAEELNLLRNPQQFATITLQPAQGVSIAHIESASPEEIVEKLGEYYAFCQAVSQDRPSWEIFTVSRLIQDKETHLPEKKDLSLG